MNPSSVPPILDVEAIEQLVHRLVHIVDALRAISGAEEGGDIHTPPAANGILTPIQVAQRLRKSRAWVYQRMADGSLPFCQVSARRRLVRQEDLEAFLISRRG
jgi:excisionase family DNA binding protein